MASNLKKKRTQRTEQPITPPNIWVVWVDHSALGVFLSEGKAMEAVVRGEGHNMLSVAYRIGHYILKGGGR